MPKQDNTLLQAALIGYQAQLAKLRSEATAIQKQLGSRGGGDAPGPFGESPKPRRKMSTAARKRIAAAQRKRWAEFHKRQGK